MFCLLSKTYQAKKSRNCYQRNLTYKYVSLASIENIWKLIQSHSIHPRPNFSDAKTDMKVLTLIIIAMYLVFGKASREPDNEMDGQYEFVEVKLNLSPAISERVTLVLKDNQPGIFNFHSDKRFTISRASVEKGSPLVICHLLIRPTGARDRDYFSPAFSRKSPLTVTYYDVVSLMCY